MSLSTSILLILFCQKSFKDVCIYICVCVTLSQQQVDVQQVPPRVSALGLQQSSTHQPLVSETLLLDRDAVTGQRSGQFTEAELMQPVTHQPAGPVFESQQLCGHDVRVYPQSSEHVLSALLNTHQESNCR